DYNTFIDLKYIHERWATCYVSPSFLGLEQSDNGESDVASSAMEWEAQTMAYSDEPCRRLLPHEFEQELLVKIRQLPPTHDDDDSISCDSHITGADDPEAYAKASLERADEADRSWLEGIDTWAASALHAGGELFSNDAQIEDPRDPPRRLASLDLDKPDYLSKYEIRPRTRLESSLSMKASLSIDRLVDLSLKSRFKFLSKKGYSGPASVRVQTTTTFTKIAAAGSNLKHLTSDTAE
ncbi:hypothetical protein FB451DRAFT_1514501, partial [Mycena latifolia]